MNFKTSRIAKVPPEISGLRFILRDDGNIRPNSQEFKELFSKLQLTIDFLKEKHSIWFRKSRGYSPEHIAEQLFKREIERKDFKAWVNYELFALINTLERIYSNLGSPHHKLSHSINIHDEIELLKDLMIEVIVFLDKAHLYVKGKLAGYGWRKTNVLNTLYIFSAAHMLFRNKVDPKSIGEFAIRPTSIFLLRQAIEIRLKNAFGVSYICDKTGKMLKIPGNYYFNLLKEAKPDEIILPVKLSILIKIYKWTNYYIHYGFMPYLWDIEWALYILEPLFSLASFGRTTDSFGAIKIKRSYFQKCNKSIKKSKDIAKLNPDLKGNPIIIRLRRPQAFVISDKKWRVSGL